MEFITALWLPILLAAVAVFLAGSVMNMVLKHHVKDYTRLPDEDAMREVITTQRLTRALYPFPYAMTQEEWKSEAVQEKFKTGPVGFVVIGRPGVSMTPNLVKHALFVLAVSIMVAYVAAAALGAGEHEYLKVFQVTGATAFLAYSAALCTNSIWFHTPWGNTLRHMLDGLLYALLTAGIFGWLW